ncbi:SixA phosphatase family protein [Natronohydrobacter thiooxidans]|uniref:SixA phosphatase family protein n=1 Tax=Natronohydrobacter thiooxidans TaxID=87172 RepID=UPI0008FF756E|nr:histidine phosphatase family protein [Natronohydrobacter thiooxidans]
MTLRLILSRHAKSEWDNPLDTDHERPLNKRGKRAAPLIGRWLVGKGHIPQEALVSDASRTRETWALLSGEFPAPVPVRFEPALYLAGPDVMQRCLATAKAPCVMMIGHNPGIAAFAEMLLETPVAHPGFARYPTCATLVAEFEAESWTELRPGSGRALDFIVPRELDQS